MESVTSKSIRAISQATDHSPRGSAAVCSKLIRQIACSMLIVCVPALAVANPPLGEIENNRYAEMTPEEDASDFHKHIQAAPDLATFVKNAGLSPALKRETAIALESKKFDLKRKLPKCSLKGNRLRCGKEELIFTSHGYVLNGTSIKFNPGETYMDNLERALNKILEPKEHGNGGKNRLSPVASAAVVVHELAFFNEFIFGR